MPSPSTAFGTFDDELQELAALDETTLALGFLRPLWDHRGERDERLLRDARVREHVDRRAAWLGADAALARLIFESPRELAARFVALLAG
jgi:hypothetical protein